MPLALVTGATGHLGAHLVRALLERGWTVRAFVRLASKLDGLHGLGVELAYGDLLDRASLERALAGVEVLFHCGAVYRNWARDPAEILRPAVEGTENALRAAAAAGVRRVVMTSSCNAVGFGDDPDRPLDETHWNADLHLPYVEAKVTSERLAWRLADELGLDVVTVLPTAVLGPLDHRMTPTTAFARELLAGTGPVLPGVSNLVHVEDVARAHVLAAERGHRGERYLVGGPNVRDVELQDIVERLTGRRPSVLALPSWALLAVAWGMEAVAALTGREPALTRGMVRTGAGRHACFDTAKARAHLGFVARGPEEVLADTARWLVRTGRSAPVARPAAV